MPEEARKVGREGARPAVARCRRRPRSTRSRAPTSTGWSRFPGRSRPRTSSTSCEAKQILDEDHYDLEKVKDRILEYLAVRALKKDLKGPILCFAGPPGVGKTSLGKSIARAMGRKFVRISLGGMRDEAEIRGHRRTYIGSLPGPDHPGHQARGHATTRCSCSTRSTRSAPTSAAIPSSALLEVLDPEQNNAFSDHYLEVPFDLSKVFFITHRQRARHDPARRCAIAWRCCASPATPRRRSSRSPRPTSCRASSSEHGLTAEQHRVHRRGAAHDHQRVHARGRACATSSARSPTSAARWRARSSRDAPSKVPVTPEQGRPSSSARSASSARSPSAPDRSGVAIGLAWTQVGRRDPVRRVHPHARARARSPSPAAWAT